MDDIKVENEGNYIQIKKSEDSPKIALAKEKQAGIKKFLSSSKVKSSHSIAPPRNDFDDFSNPDKKHEESDEEEEEDDETEMSEEMNSDDGEEYSDAGGEEELSPSPGYSSLEEEKQDLLYKLHRIKQKGVHVSSKLSVYSDVRELRAEVNKIRKDAQIDASLKMSKKALMAIVSGIEFLNNRYDPFEVELEGWSETVMLNVNDGDYDNVLERLCEKYAGRSNTPPEIEILLTLGGSAMMFHITNSMFKKFKQGKSPDMGIPSYEKPRKPTEPKESSMPSDPEGMKTEQTYANVKDMRGPSFDISNLMGGMGMGRFPPMPMMSEPRKPQVVIEESEEESDSEQEETKSRFSDSASEGGRVKNISITSSQTGSGRKRRSKVPQDQSFAI